MGTRLGLAALAALVSLAGCSTEDADRASPEPTSTRVPTLTPVVVPSRPPSGRVTAEMRQSSLDVALGQMQVWIRNDTTHRIRPRRIAYRDGRFDGVLLGRRLRSIPAGSERGFPLTLPAHPRCDSPARHGRVTVRADTLRRTLPVADETDVPGRYLARRCVELAVARVAALRWLDRVPADRPGLGSTGFLLLRIEPSGRTGRLVLRAVSGTPMLMAADAPYWRLRTVVHGTDPPTTLRLPVLPARCDDHIFMEGGGNTAFKVDLSIGGTPGQLLLRMSPAGTRAAIGWMKESCGL